MKSKHSPHFYGFNPNGFTLVELLVVLAIFGALLALGLLNFAALRGPRDLKIGANQLVTNLRKIQAYALSARNIPTTGIAAKYYILKLDTSTPTQYEVDAIDASASPQFVQGVETFTLPVTTRIASIQVEQPTGTAVNPNPTCVQIGYSLPFARTYVDTSCALFNHFQDPSDMDARADSKVTVTLQSGASGPTKTVVIYGISGRVEGQ
jgi:prepilin-type N-terminal cleavage/methylation domain-containing protein